MWKYNERQFYEGIGFYQFSSFHKFKIKYHGFKKFKIHPLVICTMKKLIAFVDEMLIKVHRRVRNLKVKV